MMLSDTAVQEFDAATNTDKAKKLTADLSHMEAEQLRLGRQCEAVKVWAQIALAVTFSLLLNHVRMACSSGLWQLLHNMTAKLRIKA